MISGISSPEEYKNKKALSIIKKWLIMTGALAGVKSTKFKADWTESKKPENSPIITWYRHQRGNVGCGYDDDAFQNLNRIRFDQLLSLLFLNTPCDSSLHHLLKQEFTNDVYKFGLRYEARIRFAAEQAIEKERRKIIAESAAPDLKARLADLKREKSILEHKYQQLKEDCIKTFNEELLPRLHGREYQSLP